VTKLRNNADDGRQEYAARGGRIIWRILMPKTRNHVYYHLNEAAEEVEILLVWNAVAGATPDFGVVEPGRDGERNSMLQAGPSDA